MLSTKKRHFSDSFLFITFSTPPSSMSTFAAHGFSMLNTFVYCTVGLNRLLALSPNDCLFHLTCYLYRSQCAYLLYLSVLFPCASVGNFRDHEFWNLKDMNENSYTYVVKLCYRLNSVLFTQLFHHFALSKDNRTNFHFPCSVVNGKMSSHKK